MWAAPAVKPAGDANRTSVRARPTGGERADAIGIRVPIEGAEKSGKPRPDCLGYCTSSASASTVSGMRASSWIARRAARICSRAELAAPRRDGRRPRRIAAQHKHRRPLRAGDLDRPTESGLRVAGLAAGSQDKLALQPVQLGLVEPLTCALREDERLVDRLEPCLCARRPGRRRRASPTGTAGTGPSPTLRALRSPQRCL